MRLKKREIPISRREMNAQMGSKRRSLPPKEGGLTCMPDLQACCKYGEFKDNGTLTLSTMY